MKSIRFIGSKLLALRWHLLFWALFITYETIVAYYTTGAFSKIIDYITFYIINIALFYLTAAIIVKNSVAGKPDYFKIALYILLEMFVYIAIKYYVPLLYVAMGIYKPNQKILTFSASLTGAIFRGIYFIGFATAYAFMRVTLVSWRRISELDKQSLQNRLEQEMLQKNLLASQYAFLKAQVNPHFLFNMLSFLHSQVYKYSEDLGDQIIHLADLMRYAFTEPESDGKVDLAAEIAHIDNYLSLNKTRFNDKIYLNFTTVGDIDNIRIIPLVLITIIENVFKYGDLSDPQNPAEINIDVTDDQLHLHISNKKTKRNHAFSSGIGMVNVQKRLDQTYPGRYEIKIDQDERHYRLDLLIKVPENNEVLYN
ncbi:hypothetical protein BEL04_18905 [Mucilaginibacter sp. PPCGB 2223]|uniref:sensor histidine kinase n=1 Tax=Mucilaginibacter sp. PPCGB 2223 TaxID=1886027 RepID=UPI0008256DEF|nr:sensor histidine kinase [Mucilaginibacter sp. PPCGB 2223]OCX50801.1 hypothetical protein BEL04_18905 [Mucilaginibacter sp. PPCGB 2223]